MIKIQEVFNKLKTAAFDGTFPSIDLLACRYRKDKTANCKQRCAVGLFIPDEKYNENMDTGCVSLEQVLADTKISELVPSLKHHDWFEIQVIHDNCAVDGWNGTEFMRAVKNLDIFKDVE